MHCQTKSTHSGTSGKLFCSSDPSVISTLKVKGRGPSLIYIVPQKAQSAAAAALCVTDRMGVQPIGRRLNPPPHTGLWPCGQTATRSPGLLFNGLHPRNPCNYMDLCNYIADTSPTKWSYVNRRSGVDQGKSASKRLTSNLLTTEPHHQR